MKYNQLKRVARTGYYVLITNCTVVLFMTVVDYGAIIITIVIRIILTALMEM